MWRLTISCLLFCSKSLQIFLVAVKLEEVKYITSIWRGQDFKRVCSNGAQICCEIVESLGTARNGAAELFFQDRLLVPPSSLFPLIVFPSSARRLLAPELASATSPFIHHTHKGTGQAGKFLLNSGSYLEVKLGTWVTSKATSTHSHLQRRSKTSLSGHHHSYH